MGDKLVAHSWVSGIQMTFVDNLEAEIAIHMVRRVRKVQPIAEIHKVLEIHKDFGICRVLEEVQLLRRRRTVQKIHSSVGMG